MTGEDPRHSLNRAARPVIRFVAFGLVVMAAAYLAYASAGRSTVRIGAGDGAADAGCIAGTAPGYLAPCEDSAAPTAARISEPEQSSDVSARVSHRHRRTPTGAGPGSASLPPPAVTGLSTRELCDAGIATDELRCRSDSGDSLARAVSGDDRRSPATPGLAISGRVMGEDGMGIPDVSVIASPTRLYGLEERPAASGSTFRLESVTDSSGAYEFHGLADGDYTIRTAASRPYRSAWTTVRAGVPYADLVLVEDDTAFVHGQVLGPEGDPLAGVMVLPVVLGGASASTDDDGRYQLQVTVKPSARSFTLRFQLPGFDEEYVPVATDRVGDPEDVAVDVVMNPIDRWTAVSGTVASSDGPALSGRVVQLRPAGQQRMYRTVTDEDGRFFFAAVEADTDYRLHVTGSPDHEDYSRQVRVTVDDADLDVVVEPYEFGEISGQMVNLAGSPVPNFHLVLRHAASSGPNAMVSSDTEGNFVVPAAPAGELVFASQSTPAITVRGVRLVPGDLLHVPLVLDWGEHEIRGLVIDRRGNPVPASRVILKWFHEAGGISSMATRRTAADAQGAFLFSHLGPGRHRLEIDAPGHDPVSLSHDASRQGYDLLVRLN